MVGRVVILENESHGHCDSIKGEHKWIRRVTAGSPNPLSGLSVMARKVVNKFCDRYQPVVQRPPEGYKAIRPTYLPSGIRQSPNPNTPPNTVARQLFTIRPNVIQRVSKYRPTAVHQLSESISHFANKLPTVIQKYYKRSLRVVVRSQFSYQNHKQSHVAVVRSDRARTSWEPACIECPL